MDKPNVASVRRPRRRHRCSCGCGGVIEAGESYFARPVVSWPNNKWVSYTLACAARLGYIAPVVGEE